jgi:hypothetical protein
VVISSIIVAFNVAVVPMAIVTMRLRAGGGDGCCESEQGGQREPGCQPRRKMALQSGVDDAGQSDLL